MRKKAVNCVTVYVSVLLFAAKQFKSEKTNKKKKSKAHQDLKNTNDTLTHRPNRACNKHINRAKKKTNKNALEKRISTVKKSLSSELFLFRTSNDLE